MEKLVRDKMPALCAKTPGKTKMNYRLANGRELIMFLMDKLKEEAKEATDALLAYKTILLNEEWYTKDQQRSALIEELADLTEVINAIKTRTNITDEEVESARQKKLADRGGFEYGIIWDGKK